MAAREGRGIPRLGLGLVDAAAALPPLLHHGYAPPMSIASESRIVTLLRTVGQAAVGLVYPPTCVACGGATGVPHALCARCWAGLRFIERPFCERLGTPFAVDHGGPLLSPAAIADPPVFHRARAVARYDEVARRLVHRLKYGDRLELARAMAGMMARAGAELLAGAEIVVPVPLHRRRLW